MNVRKMMIDDYEAVYALWLSCAGMGLNDIDDSKDGIARFLQRNPDTCFVAEKGGRVIGAIMVGNDGRRAYIYHTAVHPDCRKQGVAKAMVDRAMNELSRLGIRKVALVAFASNENGNAFWENIGFTVRNDLVYRNHTLLEANRIDS